MASLVAWIQYTPTARVASCMRRFSRRGYRIHLATERWATNTRPALLQRTDFQLPCYRLVESSSSSSSSSSWSFLFLRPQLNCCSGG